MEPATATANQRRVLVLLDSHTPQETAVDAVASISAGKRAEMLGLFVEDIRLVDLAKLPCAREIAADAAEVRSLNLEHIEQQFRSQGRRLRAQFEAAARRVRIRHSFQVVRGKIPEEVIRFGAGYDALVINHSRNLIRAESHARQMIQALISEGPETLVFVQERWPSGRNVLVLFDATEEAWAALRLGLTVAYADRLALTVLLVEPRDQTTGLREEVEAALLEETAVAKIRTISSTSLGELTRVVATEDARVMILPGGEQTDVHLFVEDLLERVACSVVTTR